VHVKSLSTANRRRRKDRGEGGDSTERKPAEAILTSSRPRPRPRAPLCSSNCRVNPYTLAARSASTQTSGGRRLRRFAWKYTLSGSDATPSSTGPHELPRVCNAGSLHTAAAARSPPLKWHTIQHHTLEVLAAEIGLLAESTVHESTLTVPTAIPVPEQILAPDEVRSTRTAGEAVMG